VIASVLAVFAYAALASVSRRWWATVLGLTTGAVVAVVMLSLLTSRVGPGGFDRYGSFTPHQVVRTTQKERTLTVAGDYLTRFPLGAGIGKSGSAASVGGGQPRLDSETEFSYLIAEVGIPGLIAFLSFQILIVSLVARRCRRIPDGDARTMLAAVGASLIAMIPLWFVTVTTAGTPLAPFMWFAAGLLSFWLITVPKRSRQQSAGLPGGGRGAAYSGRRL
jgi:hypothetical protein